MSITCRGLSFSYGGAPVLRSLDFCAKPGELVAVLGANGAGKTTLFGCILGLLHGYEGDITVDSLNARTLGARALAARIAYIPQRRPQPFGYTVFEMVLMGTAHFLSPLAQPGAKEKERAHDALESLGITEISKKPFDRISGGEQQLVLIARALAQNAKNLIMDEPTASLDYGNQARVLEAARTLADGGYTVLMATHDPQHVLNYATRVTALIGGRNAADGEPATVLDSAVIKALYGVDTIIMSTSHGVFIAPAAKGDR